MSKQPTVTATSPYHLRIRVSIQGSAFWVFPKSYSSNGDANPLCKSTFLRAANLAPASFPCLRLQASLPPPPNPGMTPSPGPLTFQIHSPRSPVHYSNCPPGTLRSLTYYPAPSHPCSMPIHSPHFFQEHFSVLFLLSCPPATPSPTWPWTFSLASKKRPLQLPGPPVPRPPSALSSLRPSSPPAGAEPPPGPRPRIEL